MAGRALHLHLQQPPPALHRKVIRTAVPPRLQYRKPQHRRPRQKRRLHRLPQPLRQNHPQPLHVVHKLLWIVVFTHKKRRSRDSPSAPYLLFSDKKSAGPKARAPLVDLDRTKADFSRTAALSPKNTKSAKPSGRAPHVITLYFYYINSHRGQTSNSPNLFFPSNHRLTRKNALRGGLTTFSQNGKNPPKIALANIEQRRFRFHLRPHREPTRLKAREPDLTQAPLGATYDSPPRQCRVTPKREQVP